MNVYCEWMDELDELEEMDGMDTQTGGWADEMR